MGTVGKIGLAVAGGVVGYFTGGLGFILMGAVIGYGVGEMIDPTVADQASVGEPEMNELQFTKAEEGGPIYDMLGTQKIVGTMLWYGYARSKELKKKIKVGGKGGGSKKKKVTIGYKYYLTWAQGLALGPCDEIISVFRYEEVVWTGNITYADAVDGKATISLAGMGSMTLHFGDNLQDANTQIGRDVGTTLNPSYRGLVWAFFNDVEIGDYNRCPTMKFVIRKTPSFLFNVQNRIGAYDYNPIHAVYYILTQMLRLPTTWINETSFSDTADQMMLESEQRGISMLFSQHKAAQAYIESILTHIGGMLYYGTDGKWHMGLIRDDVDTADMITITDDDMLEPLKVTPNTYINTLNDIKLQYSQRYDVAGLGGAAGYPDVYTFSFIDEAHEWDATKTCATATNGYTCNPSDDSPNDQWFRDWGNLTSGAYQSRLKTGSELRGLCIHTQKLSGSYQLIIPDGYTFSMLEQYGIFYVKQPNSNPSWQTVLRDMFLNSMIPSKGYVPGSWFVFNVDSTSTEQSIVDDCWDMIDDFRAWLSSSGYQYNYYGSSGMEGGEQWLKWMLDEYSS